MKVIFDTNIWISYFICKSFNELTDILLNRDFEIVISEKLLFEIWSTKYQVNSFRRQSNY